MGSDFDTAFLANAWPNLSTRFGTDGSVARAGGGTVSITGVFSLGRTVLGYLPQGEQQTEIAVFAVSADDYPNPHLDDTVVIEGRTWAVVEFGARQPVLELQLELVTQRRLGNARRGAAGGG